MMYHDINTTNQLDKVGDWHTGWHDYCLPSCRFGEFTLACIVSKWTQIRGLVAKVVDAFNLPCARSNQRRGLSRRLSCVARFAYTCFCSRWPCLNMFRKATSMLIWRALNRSLRCYTVYTADVCRRFFASGPMSHNLSCALQCHVATIPVQMTISAFLQRAAKLALQVLYMLQQIRPPLCLSVRNTPVLCQNEGT